MTSPQSKRSSPAAYRGVRRRSAHRPGGPGVVLGRLPARQPDQPAAPLLPHVSAGGTTHMLTRAGPGASSRTLPVAARSSRPGRVVPSKARRLTATDPRCNARRDDRPARRLSDLRPVKQIVDHRPGRPERTGRRAVIKSSSPGRQSRPRPGQTAAKSYFYAPPAFGVNFRFCRRPGGSPGLCGPPRLRPAQPRLLPIGPPRLRTTAVPEPRS